MEIKINPNALSNNLDVVKARAPQSKVIAMIKANAFGHGLNFVAKFFSGKVDAFGVARLSEAISLRKVGVTDRIVLFSGFLSLDELEQIIINKLDVVIYSFLQLKILKKRSFPVKIWLKINSGMNRLGFTGSEIKKACREIAGLEECVLLTHFSDADNTQSCKTEKQVAFFNEHTKNMPYEKSICNSAGILTLPGAHFDWVRPGIMLFGASPLISTVGREFGLRQSMTVTTEVLAVRKQKRGDEIGYGSEYICPENMPVGIIKIGYADGYLRSDAQKHIPILVNNKLCKIIGRVSMDLIIVDLRGAPNTKVGDTVTLWDDEYLPIEKVAASMETIPNELMIRFGQRNAKLIYTL